MKIAIVGTGYVGLVSGTCFADFGVDVVCVDTDRERIENLNRGIMPIYERGLDDLVEKQVKAERLTFTTSLEEGIEGASAIFIAVGTPSRKEDGHADLSYVYQAARDIIRAAKGPIVLVTKSTVPVGTARAIEKIAREEGREKDVDVASNPEFLREGSAIDDFMRPDRVVIGCSSERAEAVMRQLYRPLHLNETPILITSPETAEIIKYAANAFLAAKITFINEIANLCEAAGADVQHVARAMGMDTRIGAKFLQAGPGYGGSCFPKDTMALALTGRMLGTPQKIVEAVVDVNNDRQQQMAQKIVTACGGSVKGLKIGVLGLAFKPNTDDVRDAPSLVILPILRDLGASITAHDPVAIEPAQKLLSGIDFADDPHDAAADADALVILTEWSEYRTLDLQQLAGTMRQKRIIDLRNIYKPDEVTPYGFHYASIGRPDILPDAARKIAAVK